jgi:hypothetical protein
MLAGAILLTIGLLGFFFVIGPPVVKDLCAGALLYAIVRLAWAFSGAEPGVIHPEGKGQ